jgi:hypothetical protein
MTKDDLIRMADLVGYDVDDDDDVYAPASGRYGLDPRLEHFAQLVAEHTLQYKCRNVSTKSQNVYTSAERVHEIDKSIHQHGFDRTASHMAGAYVDTADQNSVVGEIDRLKDLNQRLVATAKELGAADDAHEWDDAWGKMCKLMKEVG